MPQNLQLLEALEFRGLLPSINNEQSEVPHILRGKNFNFDVSGPKSGFGAICLSPNEVPEDDTYALFRQGDNSFLFTSAGVYQLNALCGEYQLVFATTDSGCQLEKHTSYPWSQAYVADTYYYGHPSVGIVQFDTFTNTWKQWDLEEKCLSGCIYGVTASANRLIIQQEDVVGWSEIDRGDKIACSHHKNSGFQSLSLIKYGKPLGVYGTDFGFFTFTTNGIMYSQINPESPNPYKHKLFASDQLPLTAFTIGQFPDGTLVYLSKTGLKQLGRKSNNQFLYEEFEPVVSKYLKESEIKHWGRESLFDSQAIRFFVADDRQELFISFRDKTNINTRPIFHRSLVFNWAYQKWSSFDEEHVIIGDTTFFNSECDSVRYGYIRPDRLVNQWEEVPFVATDVDLTEGTCCFTSRCLNSWIEIGLFRVSDEQYADSFTMVTDCSITSGPMLHDTEFSPDIEDTTFGNIDAWEEHLLLASHFNAVISGTLDGYTLFEDQRETLTINRASEHATYYVCANQGVYHTILIEAVDTATYFHIKGLKLSGHITGRL